MESKKGFFSLRNRMNSMLNDFFYSPAWEDFHSSLTDWNPIVDIYEKDDQIIIKADLPGIEKKDIHIDVKDRVLTIKGERASENEVKKHNFYRRERALGRFERSFTLPGKVDAEDIKVGISTIEQALSELGCKIEKGKGVKAAEEVFGG